MVGFGSSLRIARRPGWEGAYLDYETLKLLLSQIEAVYEEEGHRRRRSASVGVFDPSAEEDGKPNHAKMRDYREELFLESDSDEAYQSVDESNEEESCSDMSLGEEPNKNHAAHQPFSHTHHHHPSHHSHHHHHHHHNNAVVNAKGPSNQPFLLSYSKEASSSDEDKASGCGAGVTYSFSSWTAWDKSASSAPDNKKRKNNSNNMKHLHLPEEDAFYMKGASNSGMGRDAFYMSTTIDEERYKNQRYSFLNAPVIARESTSLLPTSSTPAQGGSNLYTFSTGGSNENITPPVTMYGAARDGSTSAVTTVTSGSVGGGGGGSGSSVGGGGGGVVMGEHSLSSSPIVHTHHVSQHEQKRTQQRFMEERKRERYQRRIRRRRVRRERERLEKKIPRHLRLAHSKARAITERFLGLVRAETEKVMLFAQARLGELADTAGSLRFSNLNDDFDSNSMIPKESAVASFDYPLSDAGLHPSASSSEDEGAAAGQGTWSDSSDEKEGNSERIASVFLSKSTSQDENQASRRKKRDATSKPTLKEGTASALKDGAQTSATVKVQEYANAAARRQIAHFTELRKRRPVFLRNDQILGEDMLLISAVEEVDGYTAVGVELIHVLRYICVNLIAVRKICLKHDRLLMNRMLGGYYHRARAPHKRDNQYSHIEDAQTLGGLIARTSGDIYEAHPALINTMSQYKLVGLYDRKIQKLANSRTVQVISSCLALALSEYEVAKSRANALTKLNSGRETPKRSGGVEPSWTSIDILEPVLSDDECGDGPPSTTSSISLTRLRFTVTSIFALREAARYKTQHFYTYLSRSLLTFTGRPIIGEGLDGCSRATLDFFVEFNPDAALLLDTNVLFDGLNKGRWMKESLADLMISTLGVAAVGSASSLSPIFNLQDLLNVINCVNIDPESRQLDIKRFMLKSGSIERINHPHPELSLMALHLNAAGCLLYMMNYYLAHATTNTFVASTGAPFAYSSIVIGAPNLSALIMAIFHGFVLSGDHSSHNNRTTVKVGLIWKLMIFSGFAGLVGNVIHGLAIDKQSIPLALLGRFIVGFSSAEILHRQLVQAFWASQVVSASAAVVLYRVSGTFGGLCLGILAELVPLKFTQVGIRSMQFASWLMSLFWFVHIIRLLVRFYRNPPALHVLETPVIAEKPGESVEDADGEDGYVSSDSDHIGTPRSIWSASKLAENSVIFSQASGDDPLGEDESAPLKRLNSKDIRNRGTRGGNRSFGARLRKLISYHVAIPTLLFIVFYVNYATEIFFTATPLVTHHYFDWPSPRAVFLLVLITCMTLPVFFFCERIARRYEERTILKRTMILTCLGSFILINWTSFFFLARSVPNLLISTQMDQHTNTYDCGFGVFQYNIGVIVTFIGIFCIESATLSLLSKLAPLRLRSAVLSLGTVVVVIGFSARIVADLQLLSVVLSHRLINTDIINTVAIPLFLFSLPIMWLVRRHFFYLM